MKNGSRPHDGSEKVIVEERVAEVSEKVVSRLHSLLSRLSTTREDTPTGIQFSFTEKYGEQLIAKRIPKYALLTQKMETLQHLVGEEEKVIDGDKVSALIAQGEFETMLADGITAASVREMDNGSKYKEFLEKEAAVVHALLHSPYTHPSSSPKKSQIVRGHGVMLPTTQVIEPIKRGSKVDLTSEEEVKRVLDVIKEEMKKHRLGNGKDAHESKRL
ncbi:hypothetical protein PsorP6_003221 [Peronosclerospora sorghi]|uniref:Uncharacterized protein n=1 Tax=Peronosclerospora sorghi TaxID=230839 RepID=A0ACC0VRA3_9STRA|nr:hypothetical protein PsorP6_003221 [Peronosclerospora sorghi]